MIPLRFFKWWLGLGWFFVIAIVIISLIPTQPSIDQTGLLLALYQGDKLEHFMAYFILMGWFAQIYHDVLYRRRYMIGLLLLGGGLEILQGLTGIREADWSDFFANSIGVLVAWQGVKNRFAYGLFYLEQIVEKWLKPL